MRARISPGPGRRTRAIRRMENVRGNAERLVNDAAHAQGPPIGQGRVAQPFALHASLHCDTPSSKREGPAL